MKVSDGMSEEGVVCFLHTFNLLSSPGGCSMATESIQYLMSGCPVQYLCDGPQYLILPVKVKP